MLSTSAREGANSLTISEKKEKGTKPSTEKSVRKGRTRHCLKSKYGSACVVCKEDHKACDGNRPCSRCVALGIAGYVFSFGIIPSDCIKSKRPFCAQ